MGAYLINYYLWSKCKEHNGNQNIVSEELVTRDTIAENSPPLAGWFAWSAEAGVWISV